MEYLLSSIIGYALGSFPTAYLLIKKTKGMDITTHGSGNMGAMNSFAISKSKVIGLTVLLIDALKGLLSVYLTLLILPVNFVFPALALIFSAFSHCFNPWLKLKGGRGLATAAGGSLLLFPFLLVVWLVIWAVVYLVKKDVLFANIWSTFMSLVIIFISDQVAYKYSFPKAENISSLMLFSTGILVLIFIKHIEPLKEMLSNKKLSMKNQRYE
jgi:glycerol-3-phosphate acyltransferase PlsY